MLMTEAPPTAPPRRSFGPRLILVLFVVAAVIVFFVTDLHRIFSWDNLVAQREALQQVVQRHLLLAALAFFAVYVVFTALSLPAAAVLSLVGGALFGRWLGTGLVSIAATLGATLAFLMSRYLFRDWVRLRWGDRLEALDRGVEKDGAYYLLTLRLVPVFPFFLINLGMGLTRMPARTFVWVSWLGMLPGTFLYLNAGQELGRIDAPREALSPAVLISLALLGIVPLAIRKFMQSQIRLRTVGIAFLLLLLVASGALAVRTKMRYAIAPEMTVAVREFTNAEYPEDPAERSVHHGQYNGRSLKLIQKDETHFDFVFEPQHDHLAMIAFRDVDVSLMSPTLPQWTKGDAGLTRIALTDRQWNRQQVNFGKPGPLVEVSGGDGFEEKALYSAELAKNCLNAGLWEVLLFTQEDGAKKLYYQGWFTFPLGQYKRLFERGTGLPYTKHWYYLEHWFDPKGTPIQLDGLRKVADEWQAEAKFDEQESILIRGEQVRKRRTTMAENVRTWQDYTDHKIRFATFIPPGRYSNQHPWKNEYQRLKKFDGATLRKIVSPARTKELYELELRFQGKGGDVSRFFVSGFDLDDLKRLPVERYPEGTYMPMGIGVPPFNQKYEELRGNPPHESPYFCLWLDADGRWINHHDAAIDGPILHLDDKDATRLHVYLLSYERHALIGHYVVSLRQGGG